MLVRRLDSFGFFPIPPFFFSALQWSLSFFEFRAAPVVAGLSSFFCTLAWRECRWCRGLDEEISFVLGRVLFGSGLAFFPGGVGAVSRLFHLSKRCPSWCRCSFFLYFPLPRATSCGILVSQTSCRAYPVRCLLLSSAGPEGKPKTNGTGVSSDPPNLEPQSSRARASTSTASSILRCGNGSLVPLFFELISLIGNFGARCCV